jgi:hypothetical protein
MHSKYDILIISPVFDLKFVAGAVVIQYKCRIFFNKKKNLPCDALDKKEILNIIRNFVFNAQHFYILKYSLTCPYIEL